MEASIIKPMPSNRLPRRRRGPTASMKRIARAILQLDIRNGSSSLGWLSISDDYLANPVQDDDVRSLRQTQRNLPDVLERAKRRVQFVHVQGKGDYAVLSVEKLEALTAKVNIAEELKPKVTITALLADIGEGRGV